MKEKIMIVDDDQNIIFAFQELYEEAGHPVMIADNGSVVLDLLEKEKPAILFLDVKMPGMDGLAILGNMHERGFDTPVILITGYSTMQTAIRAMQLGAYDYLTKPLDIEKVRITGQRALEAVRMRRQLRDLQLQLEEKRAHTGQGLIGKNPRMLEIYKKIGVISTTPNTTNVLILGESGTGKELVARAIHESGHHPEEPFLAINCTVLPENLLESELFGHEKGAFTGAERRKLGKFEVAGNGTIFLDEIGDMPESLQKKLLRVIQERIFERLGGHEVIPLHARIMAATHRNLAEAVQKGEFREDFYYRLNVLEIILPPLREHKDDIPLLTNHFLEKYNEQLGKSIKAISPEVTGVLNHYGFPGNIRELENMIERAVALERGEILTPEAFPQSLFQSQGFHAIDIPIVHDDFTLAKQAVVEAFEKKFLIERLTTTGGNVTDAARISGIERQSFQRLMKKYDLNSADFRNR